jgi:2-polyprenyl-3-methyl-5-hydroxy-6-metoxy-1,4-benzoquinol methylase
MTEAVAAPLVGTTAEARLNRYRVFDEVNAPYLRWQLAQLAPWVGRRVLEVGCGVGSILAQLGPRDDVMGVDLEEELIAFVRGRFAGDARYAFARMDISALTPTDRALLKEHRFDSVLCINVLEHVEDDEAAIRAMADVVEPGGSICLIVPAHPSLYGAYDRMEGHFRRYSRARLRQLVAGANLQPAGLYRFNAAGAIGWWIQYRVLRRNIHGQSHFRALQAALPLLAAAEKAVNPPVGLSLVAIATRAR